MVIYSTNRGRVRDWLTKMTAAFFAAVLIFGPVGQAWAQTADENSTTTDSAISDTESSSQDTPIGTNTPDTIVDDSTPVINTPEEPESDVASSTSEEAPAPVDENQQERAPPADLQSNASTSEATTSVENQNKEEQKPKVLTKFKKNSNLSPDAELAAVRQHLIDNDISPDIIARLDTFEAEQKAGPQEDGILKKIFDFFTGNTDAQKEQRKVEELAAKQPFKTESFEGSIRTANANSYDQLFPNQKEQSKGLLQKIQNFFKNGSSINSNFDGTEESQPLSWLMAPKAEAQVSDNPNDYLAASGEIVFSQSIQNKANELNRDPLALLNFVRNDISYIPYYGSKKGADATLIEAAGNDTDKASLLIALLRSSNVPARYRQVDIKADISSVTDLLGVDSAIAAAQMLSLNNIPYILFTDTNGNPLFFVIEHTYVEAYIPYGYSRGADMNDGGTSQWVPMDPTFTRYTYEQLIDVVGGMNAQGFNVETFFNNYLNGNYGSSTQPLDAFKTEVGSYLATSAPAYYSGITYGEALVRSYKGNQRLDFIPGSLPYEVVAYLNTYDYFPSSLRHTVQFSVKDKNNTQILNYTAYVSDLADKELLVTFDAATPADQATINSFDTIYDVVPLSLVAVYTKIKVNSVSIATTTATSTLGQAQSYSMQFNIPTRQIGASVNSSIADTINRDVIVGNTDAIAIDTDRVVSPDFRPGADTTTHSFVANQALYKTGLSYLQRLENTEHELANIIGGDFADTVTRATIFNGVAVTYSGGQPYSFDWKGLRIDSSAKVRYFNRFKDDIATYKKEFTSVFGLQGSQDESDIFEDNFDVESVATVKGLKLVSAGAFPGITLHKITSANESDIDSLTISTTTKAIFHTAVQSGKTLFTPSAPFTYHDWTGLVYITIDFNQGVAGYIIGEGLNGGYTVEQFPTGWTNFLVNVAGTFSTLSANITSPTNGQTFYQNSVTLIPWQVQYTATLDGVPVTGWSESLSIPTLMFPLGSTTLRSGYGTNSSVHITLQNQQLGEKYTDYDQKIIQIATKYSLPPDLLKSVIYQESIKLKDDQGRTVFDAKSYRYEAHKDYDWYSGPSSEAENRIEEHPERHFAIGGTADHGSVTAGNQIPSDYLEYSKHTSGYPNGLNLTGKEDGNLTAQELLDNNNDYFWKKYKGAGEDWSFTAQLLLASSYGLGQLMYDTAKVRGFDTTPSTGLARPITDLFNPEVSIDLSAKRLANAYSTSHDWLAALNSYNGGGDPSYAPAVYDRWNNGNGDFQLIVKNY